MKDDEVRPMKQGLSSMAMMVLIFLALQNCVKNIVMRAAVRGHATFLYSAAVIATEALKCAASVVWVLVVDGGSIMSIVHFLIREWRRTVLLAVPAAIYNLQKTLEYIALGNLNAAVFAVLVQTKLFTTAICAVAIMGKTLRKAQVISLVLLTVGCILAQLQSSCKATTSGGVEDSGNHLIGVVATLMISFSSGFASVYTEKVIKGADPTAMKPVVVTEAGNVEKTIHRNRISSSDELTKQPAQSDEESSLKNIQEDDSVERGVVVSPITTTTTTKDKPTFGLAYTQIQLAVASLIIEGAWAAATDYAKIQENGLWAGFGSAAWIAVSMTALGGIAVAAVLKFADAILKGYATAISVVLTGLASHALFGTDLNLEYGLGMINVLAAMLLYNSSTLDKRAF